MKEPRNEIRKVGYIPPCEGFEEEEKPDARSLKSIALYLEGIKAGKGNLLPLGDWDLLNLWNTIKYLNNNQ